MTRAPSEGVTDIVPDPRSGSRLRSEPQHIAVDVLVNRFSSRTQKILHVLNSLVCFFFFSVATWHIVKKANVLRQTGEVTETLQIIYYPFTYAVALGFGVLCLVLLANAAKALFQTKENLN